MSESSDQVLALPIEVPADWERKPLRDMVEFVADGDWVESKDQGGSDFRLLQISNIGTGSFVETGNFRYITKGTFERLRCTEILAGDVLVARMPEPTGRAWFVGGLADRCITSVDVAIVRPLPTRLDGRYLSYFLNTPINLSRVDGLATGTTRRRVRRADLARLEIPVPPLAEQRAIAGVLGALDDKIESNRRLAQLVDALVRAEYASAAFAADAEETELGVIATRVSQPADPSAIDGSTPYIGLEHMPRGCMVLDAWGTADGLESGKSFFAEGDVLFGKLRPYFRKVGVAPVRGVCSTDILVLRPRRGLGLLAAVAASDELIAYASSAASGTKMPRVSWDYLSRYRVTVPGPSTADALEAVVVPALDRARQCVLENQSLSALRDALLPELLSGRLRVRDAEKHVEGAV